MTRNEFERYLGKCVTITLSDNTVIEGTLHKTGEKAFADNPNLSIPLNFYFCTDKNNEVVKNTVFRVSHIQKISYNEKTYCNKCGAELSSDSCREVSVSIHPNVNYDMGFRINFAFCEDCFKKILGNEEYNNFVERETVHIQKLEKEWEKWGISNE